MMIFYDLQTELEDCFGSRMGFYPPLPLYNLLLLPPQNILSFVNKNKGKYDVLLKFKNNYTDYINIRKKKKVRNKEIGMGLAASQTRLVTLTARKIDLEIQGQNINQQRLNIAAQEEQLAQNYSAALSKTVLQLSTTDAYGDTLQLALTAGNLQNSANTVICDSNGKPIAGNTPSVVIAQGLQDGQYQSYTIGTDGGSYNSSGSFVNSAGTAITNIQSGINGYTEYNWNSTLPNGSPSHIQSSTDTDGEAQAEAVYQSALAQIEPQDKMLEMRLKDVDTQHQAIQTEMDAVKKVIDKDIDSTFKTFSGNG